MSTTQETDPVAKDRTPMSNGDRGARTTTRDIQGVRRGPEGYKAFGSAAALELSAGALNVGGVPVSLSEGGTLHAPTARAYVRPEMHRDGVLFVMLET